MNAITAMIMALSGTQTPMAIFAPVERSSLDGLGEVVEVGDGRL
jgi:hypothetical protein